MLFSPEAAPFTFHQQCTKFPVSPHLCQHLSVSIVLMITVLWVHVQCCLLMVLICIFLVTSDASIFSGTYWSFLYLLRRHVYPMFACFLLLSFRNPFYILVSTYSSWVSFFSILEYIFQKRSSLAGHGILYSVISFNI
jgi:hypothetical protein